MINIDDEQSMSGKNEREKPAQEKCRKETDKPKASLLHYFHLKFGYEFGDKQTN